MCGGAAVGDDDWWMIVGGRTSRMNVSGRWNQLSGFGRFYYVLSCAVACFDWLPSSSIFFVLALVVCTIAVGTVSADDVADTP